MSDLWPDFGNIEHSDENSAIKIIREQARALGQKLGNRVKATFSKVSYSKAMTGLTSALSMVATISAATQPKLEEVLEEELQDKTDMSELLREQKYKFEIFNDSYRFRLFLYTYTPLYPNKIVIDENIAKEINKNMELTINSDQELEELLQTIFSSIRVRRIIGMMVSEANGEGKKKD